MQRTIRAVLIATVAATVLSLQGADAPKSVPPVVKVEAPKPLSDKEKAELWKILAYLQLEQKAAEETPQGKKLKASNEEYNKKMEALQKPGFSIGPDTDFAYKPVEPKPVEQH